MYAVYVVVLLYIVLNGNILYWVIAITVIKPWWEWQYFILGYCNYRHRTTMGMAIFHNYWIIAITIIKPWWEWQYFILGYCNYRYKTIMGMAIFHIGLLQLPSQNHNGNGNISYWVIAITIIKPWWEWQYFILGYCNYHHKTIMGMAIFHIELLQLPS